jgi:hypothetical protein
MRALARTVVLSASCLALTPLDLVGQQANEIGAELNRLVSEGGNESRMNDGVLHLRNGNGWIRTRRIFADFMLSAEVRLVSANTELSIGIPTINTLPEWPKRGYRLRLGSVKPAELVSSGYDLKRQDPRSISTSVGEWHAVTIVAKGPRLEISIDGQTMGTYAIEVLAGSLLFQAAGDDAEVRKISFDTLDQEGVFVNKEKSSRSDFVSPKLVKEVRPTYPKTAMGNDVQGWVGSEAVVPADGSVGGVWLTKLLHAELEHAGLDALRKWRFTPAVLNGASVPSIIQIEMSFTLK